MLPLLACCFGKSSSKTPTLPKWPSRSTGQNGDISQKWKALMGEHQWEDLLDPLDLDLRRIIIHYGEMAQATYDTFIRAKYSKFAGTSRFSKDNFFNKLGLELGHPYRYKITKFLYATSGIDLPESFILKSLSREAWSKESNFIGYVAVAEDDTVALLGRREIVVAWRGTMQSLEWVNDFQFLQVSASSIVGETEAKVHQGWMSMYTCDDLRSHYNKSSARHQVQTELRRLIEQFKNEEVSITVTGHSLGAALATLNAVDIVASNINLSKHNSNVKPCMVTTILFASPRVGDDNFKTIVSQYDHLRILHIRNISDVVPNYPFIGYSQVGVDLKIDTKLSPYIKNPILLVDKCSNWHNLEAYLHGVAGTHGSEGGFELVVHRDLSLLNKLVDILKDEYNVPIAWWVLKNKGMVQQDDGFWLLMDCEMDV